MSLWLVALLTPGRHEQGISSSTATAEFVSSREGSGDPAKRAAVTPQVTRCVVGTVPCALGSSSGHIC